jgi:hypothetical protein
MIDCLDVASLDEFVTNKICKFHFRLYIHTYTPYTWFVIHAHIHFTYMVCYTYIHALHIHSSTTFFKIIIF